MSESPEDLAASLRDTMRSLERLVDGFRGVRINIEHERACMVFHWFDDPNLYEFCSAPHGGSWTWDTIEALDLEEELETGFLLRATKRRAGRTLRIDLDAGQLREIGDRSFYLSELLDYVGHLSTAGLDTAPGLAATHAGALLSWTSASINSATGGPPIGQIVTVRDTMEDARIAHLELNPQARPVVGHELVFTAIHQAARRGIHRIHSPRSLAPVEPFGFIPTADRSDMVVYDITREDLNWPERLSQSATI